jgi:zinc transporter, ZIP family
MTEFFKVLAFATLPAFGNFVGAVLAEIFPVSQKMLSLALHAAVGVVLAVVAVELMPQVLAGTEPWIVVLCFLTGGGGSMLLDKATDFISSRTGTGCESGPWALYAGVAVDLLSDGLLIGTGSTLSFSLGLLLAIGQVPADIPEGFSSIATFKNQGVSRRMRMLLAVSFVVPIFLGATLGYWVMQGLPAVFKFMTLAFIAGILITVAIEEIVPLAHKGKESRWASLSLVGGFALFLLISAYF